MMHQASLLHPHTNISRHGFFAMSDASGNCQNGAFIAEEAVEDVKTRRGQMAEQLGLNSAPIMSLKQIHSDKVVTLTENWETGHAPQADGMVTQEPGLILGILTADCGPLLFLDPKRKIIGACHAGWKGAAAGIIENTLTTMESLGAERHRIQAVLGPTIQQSSYEVGPEFPLQLLRGGDLYSQFFKTSIRPGHHMFDLPAYIRQRLVSAGIMQFQDLNRNTYTDHFFSRRRSVAEKQAYDKKANLSVIALL